MTVGTAAFLAQGDVTVLEGSSFCLSDRAGDIKPHHTHGMFVKDTRVISAWELYVDDRPLEPLGVVNDDPFAATFVCRAAARAVGAEPTVVVERHRWIADDLREDITIHNFGQEALGVHLTLAVDADFADLFDVKDGCAVAVDAISRQAFGGNLVFTVTRNGRRRGVRVVSPDAMADRHALTWRIVVPPHSQWSTSVEVLPSDDGEEQPPSFPPDRPVDSALPSRRMRDWHESTPDFRCDLPTLQTTVECSFADLGALRIRDPAHPDMDVVAAGAPWFMAVFGRDSLLTSWMTLPWDPSLTRATLTVLARLQGRGVDPFSEEEPGRILHEVRLGIDESRALGGRSIYYGSVDATPLFVMLLDRAVQWGLPDSDLGRLLPAADAALAWIRDYGDIDGDGFVEYRRKTDRGLVNQGWKDSRDSIADAAGRTATGAVALAEVQGYVYGAYLARARMAEYLNDAATESRYLELAAALRAEFNRRFWLPDRGYYALALDGDKEPVDALASNQAHCLWTGIVDEQKAPDVGRHLLSPAMFSGWGIRTLAETMPTFNPISYHNGSVWPHDNALAVAGLMRYGLKDAAATVATALLDAAAAFGGRLPELFCGFSRDRTPWPVPYPTSCSPQAWAAATPLSLLADLLGLVPDRARGRVEVTNSLPASWGRVRVTGLSVGDATVDIDSARTGRDT